MSVELFQFLMVQLKDLLLIHLRRLQLFQFLMVQLKESTKQDFNKSNSVSIPYGTIKRKKYFESNTSEMKFQFLMVQLKALRQYGEFW